MRPDDEGVHGWVHSYETLGTLDGPGVRFVVFLSGCMLRCQYCHNPDTWQMKYGTEVSIDEVMDQIQKYAAFLKSAGGGVTVSGGEPMAQMRFLSAILARSKDLGLHTALDTCGYLGRKAPDQLLEDTDLFLLDIKSWLPETHRKVTSRSVKPILEFAERLAAASKPTWLRFVVVPGLTDDPENVDGLAEFAAGLGNIERVELLPFHKMGEEKWRALKLDYQLTETPPPGPDLMERAAEPFRRRGLTVV